MKKNVSISCFSDFFSVNFSSSRICDSLIKVVRRFVACYLVESELARMSGGD